MNGVYYLSDDERKFLVRGLLPKSRQTEVAEELRGWNWHQPPLEPPYGVRLALYEVAGKYCQTSRDVFLRRVHDIRGRPSRAMLAGGYYHAVIVSELVRAKRLIYALGVKQHDRIERELAAPGSLPALPKECTPEDAAELTTRGQLLADFQASRIRARFQDILTRQPYIGDDSLAAITVPVVTEQRLDGSFLGLSQRLSADALSFTEPMIVDLKFGRRQDFHRLTTTGYALVMEAVHEYPVNIGCIVYAHFQDGRLVLEKDFHLIDDELRQWFVEERDEKARMVAEEMDPGQSDDCTPTCPFFTECHPG